MEPATKPNSIEEKPTSPPAKRRKRSWLRIFGVIFLAFVLCGAAIRPFLPWIIRSYVNRTLDKSQVYQGKIGDVEVHLWRGAYSIRDIRMIKMTGDVPVPLFSAKRVDFAIEWDAILHRRLVGRMQIEEPELNFVDAPDTADAQTGAEGPWLEIIKDLFPFKINRAVIKDGAIHFRTYHTKEPVDVYLSHLSATIDDLTNIHGDVTPLVTTVTAHALAMDQAEFEYRMKLNPFSYRPTYHMAARVLGLDVTKTNSLARAYGAFDFKRGVFDLVVELDVKEGDLSGYVKPIFRNLQVFSLMQDIKQDNPLEFFWSALVAGSAELLKNRPRDQVATLIPFRGDASEAKADILATIGNVLRNAFIRAYLPKLQNGGSDVEGLHFGPPTITDSLVGEPDD